MYIPQANEETRLPVLHALIHAQPFCSLVTMGATGLFATHLPMVLHAEEGVLRGHISRANRQWRDYDPAVPALAIFAGPQHYISPSWYPEKQEHHKVVPTWNYAVVHAYGTLRTVEDPEWLLAHLHTLTDRHEQGSAVPWRVEDAPAEYVQTLSRGIVGLEIAIDRLEGKWKISQNRSERDRLGVVDGLAALGDEESLAMRDLVQATMKKDSAT